MLGWLIALLLMPHEPASTLLDRGRKLTVERSYELAIWTFGQALVRDPTMARAYSGRGYAKLSAKRLDGTHADFERAASLEPDAKFQALVWNHMGQVDELAGDATTAIGEYERALTYAPNKSASEALKRLKP